jgi:2-polyprenyl-3-methyl-5-hydroxy-6-metoxy-1,4-benzoquinol methylase
LFQAEARLRLVVDFRKRIDKMLNLNHYYEPKEFRQMALYENIAKFYDEIFPLKQTRLNFIESFLKNNLKVLDIGCATGELALALAKKGHQVVGIDLDEKMIALAREKTKRLGLNTEFFIKDMIKIGEGFSPASFDAVLCFGNTLVHLENPGKIKGFFIGIHKVLKSGGILLVQVVNYDRILSGGIKELPLLKNENFIFRREYRYDEVDHRIRFLTHLTIKKNGEVVKSSETLYPLTSRELKDALDHAGFSKLQFFGSEGKMPYDKNSPALVATAEKSRG